LYRWNGTLPAKEVKQHEQELSSGAAFCTEFAGAAAAPDVPAD